MVGVVEPDRQSEPSAGYLPSSHLDARRQRGRRELEADRRVQLVEPRAGRVDHGDARADDRAVLERDARAARVRVGRLERGDALVEAHVDAVAHARAEQVFEARRRVDVAAAVLVDSGERAETALVELVPLVVVRRQWLGRDQRELKRVEVETRSSERASERRARRWDGR